MYSPQFAVAAHDGALPDGSARAFASKAASPIRLYIRTPLNLDLRHRKQENRDASLNIATVYAFRGEADKAFAWLDKTIEYGDAGIGEIVTENLFDKLHADLPRAATHQRRSIAPAR